MMGRTSTYTRTSQSLAVLLACPLLAILAPGCFNPQFEDGIRCSRFGACPGSLQCNPADNRCYDILPDVTCDDGVRNGAETDTDCGGTCAPCDAGQICSAPADCQSGVCTAGSCAAGLCGDGVQNQASEMCDDGGQSAQCDADCSAAQCGDSQVNEAAGEVCDDGEPSADCDGDCTAPECGDGSHNPAAGEGCDDAGESAACDTDCTVAECGDGLANSTAGEACDDAGESADCDIDCTPVECGDGQLNEAAGEACDDGNTTFGDGCDDTCAIEYPPSCRAILDAGMSTGDGVYFIDPDGLGPGLPFQVYCEMDFLGGGWVAVYNMMERASNNAEAASMHASLLAVEPMLGPVMPDSTSAAIHTASLPLGDYTQVVYGWAPSANDDVTRWGTYSDAAGLTGACYLDGYCGTNSLVGNFDIQPSGTVRGIYTGSDPGYPHVGLGFSGQIIVWGYDNNNSIYGGWGNWHDSNPCCDAGNTSDMTNPGWRYVIYIR